MKFMLYPFTAILLRLYDQTSVKASEQFYRGRVSLRSKYNRLFFIAKQNKSSELETQEPIPAAPQTYPKLNSRNLQDKQYDQSLVCFD